MAELQWCTHFRSQLGPGEDVAETKTWLWAGLCSLIQHRRQWEHFDGTKIRFGSKHSIGGEWLLMPASVADGFWCFISEFPRFLLLALRSQVCHALLPGWRVRELELKKPLVLFDMLVLFLGAPFWEGSISPLPETAGLLLPPSMEPASGGVDGAEHFRNHRRWEEVFFFFLGERVLIPLSLGMALGIGSPSPALSLLSKKDIILILGPAGVSSRDRACFPKIISYREGGSADVGERWCRHAAGAGWLPLSRLSPQLFISLLHHTAAATLLPALRISGQGIVSTVSAAGAALDTAVLQQGCISHKRVWPDSLTPRWPSLGQRGAGVIFLRKKRKKFNLIS